MAKVSVIVPVYNVEKYLDKCLKSLLNQTLKDIEIIVVNDGTPDNSQKIIDKYSKKDKRIKAFIKPNGGLSDARNYGIERASGEYIGFVDSDDYVDKEMFSKLYEKAVENDYDVVGCNVYYVDEKGNILTKAISKIKTDKNVKKNMVDIYPAAWNKIYKKELFKSIKFKKNVWFEDVEFLYRLFPTIKSLASVDYYGYYYVQREGAITKTFNSKLYDYIDNWNGIVEFYKKHKYYEKYYKELEYSYVRYIYATFVKQASHFEKKEFSKAIDIAIQNVKKQFPHYRKNKYFYKSLKGIYLLFFSKKLAYTIFKGVGEKK